MDPKTLEQLADFICGDGDEYPVRRSGSELTRFFQRAGFSNYIHDGSTRKWWTLKVLNTLNGNDIKRVIHRLADPREYEGKQLSVAKAIKKLNDILKLEGLKVEIKEATPIIKEGKVDFPDINIERERELKPLPAPNFELLKLESNLAIIMKHRWDEVQKCIESEAYLAAIIMMGSMLEGIFLAVFQRFPKEANQSKCAPIEQGKAKVKHFGDWKLSEMINVAHDLGWIDLDVKKFSHALREFRNLIHPYEQMQANTFPDKDTSEISWLVVQAAINDLSKLLK